MKETFITRHDTDVGVEVCDSIAWAFENHVKQEDEGLYDSAMLYGNEDAPVRIEFYTFESPTIHDTPAFIWTPAKEEA